MDKQIKKAICNMKKDQRDIFFEAFKKGQLTIALVSNASGERKPIKLAGRMTAITRLKDSKGNSIWNKKYNADTGEPFWNVNKKSYAKWADISGLKEILDMLDKK